MIDLFSDSNLKCVTDLNLGTFLLKSVKNFIKVIKILFVIN